MMSTCKWCHLTDKEKEGLLFETANWSVYLADIQDYVGRCILVLNRHCGCISELNTHEWLELKEIVDSLEKLYREVLGADLCNWSCLMNNFYKDSNPNPHLHIHVRPRYSKPVVIHNHDYIDTEFAHHYALKKESQLLDEDRKTLFTLMRKHLVSYAKHM